MNIEIYIICEVCGCTMVDYNNNNQDVMASCPNCLSNHKHDETMWLKENARLSDRVAELEEFITNFITTDNDVDLPDTVV